MKFFVSTAAVASLTKPGFFTSFTKLVISTSFSDGLINSQGSFCKKIREPSQLVKYKISPQLPIVFIPKIKLKMVGGAKFIVWLFFSSLLAFMGSADGHAIDTFSNALLPISAHTCPSTDIQMSQTEWNM